MADGHKLFPLGILCAHCHRWHELLDAIQHVDVFHRSCATCGAETTLARSLLEEAGEALDRVVELRLRGAAVTA